MTTPGSLNFTYSYNARNQLDSLTNPNSVSMSFTYDNGGRRTRVTRPGSYIDYQYNARNWLTAVLNRTTGGTTRYDARYYYQDGSLWDHTGNPVKRTEDFGSGLYTTTLRYDNVYRQTEETLRDPSNTTVYSESYGYDAVGNRTSMTKDGVSYTYTYDDSDKLTGVSGGGQSASMTYDNNGNMTGVSGTMFGSKTLVYDDENRLKQITYGGVTDFYYYNWQGQRYRARLNGTYWRYVYNGDRVLEETSDGGTVVARYTTESGSYYQPLHHMWRSSSTSRFPLYDAIGTARMLVDASGSITDTYHLDAWGSQLASSGTTVNPYRYGAAWGYITDPSGMLQLGARFYWPEVGRFVQQDPLRSAWSGYAYASDRPTVLADPAGLAANPTFDKAGWLSCMQNTFIRPQTLAAQNNWFDCGNCAIAMEGMPMPQGLIAALATPSCLKCMGYSTFMFFYCLFSNIHMKDCPSSPGYGVPPDLFSNPMSHYYTGHPYRYQ